MTVLVCGAFVGLSCGHDSPWLLVLMALCVSHAVVIAHARRRGWHAALLIALFIAAWHAGATWWVVLAVRRGGDWPLLWQALVLGPLIAAQVFWHVVTWAVLHHAAAPRAEPLTVTRVALMWWLSFCAADALRQLGWSGDPYGSLGVALLEVPGVAMLMPWIGAQGVTWLATGATCAAAALWLQMRATGAITPPLKRSLVAAGASCCAIAGVATLAPGDAFTADAAAAPLNFTVLQPVVVGRGTWNADVRDRALDALALAIAHTGPAGIVVTPESYLYEPPPSQPVGAWGELVDQVDAAGVNVLLGMPFAAADPREAHLNAVVHLAPERLAVYAKERLVPGAEYLPLQDWLGPLYRQALDRQGRSGEPAHGALTQPLYLAGHEVGLSICHELAFATTMAERAKGVSMLVNLSLDGWIPSAQFRHQLHRIAHVRAMELAKPLLRVADGGGSILLDARGRTVAPSRRQGHEVFFLDVAGRDGDTPYARLAHVLALLPVVVALALIAWQAAPRLRSRTKEWSLT